jgi:hypothetical protein
MDEFYCGEETEDFFAELFFREEKPKAAFIGPKVLRKFRRFRIDSEMPKDKDGDYEVAYGWCSNMNQLMGKRLPDDFEFHAHLDFYIQDDMVYTTLPEGEHTYAGNWICGEDMTIVVEEWVSQ